MSITIKLCYDYEKQLAFVEIAIKHTKNKVQSEICNYKAERINPRKWKVCKNGEFIIDIKANNIDTLVDILEKMESLQ